MGSTSAKFILTSDVHVILNSSVGFTKLKNVTCSGTMKVRMTAKVSSKRLVLFTSPNLTSPLNDRYFNVFVTTQCCFVSVLYWIARYCIIF